MKEEGNMAIEITRNACEKVMQYAGLKENAARKLIKRAYVWGTDIRDLPSREKKYYFHYVDIGKRKAYVYAGCCFIFAGDYCVTVLKSPNRAAQKARFDGKTKVRNPKKYIRHYDAYGFDELAYCG